MERKNLVKRSLFLVVLAVIFLFVILIMARYEEEGEKVIPFDIAKMLIVSSVNGVQNTESEHVWDIDVSQVNDIYVYIERNKNEDETIKEIVFENFKTYPEDISNIKIYRPTGELEKLYLYSTEDYKEKSIAFLGTVKDDMKNLEIANIGGMCGFRLSNENLGKFVSDEETEEIIYDGRLLEKIGILNENVKLKLAFDIIIKTDDGINYRGNVVVDMPGEGLIEEGKTTIEINDFENVIFKRF